jgi:rod shape-determining protein MreC
VRTLLLLIRKFRNLLLFVFLEIVAIMLIIKSKNIQGADLLSSSNAIAAFFYKKKNDVVYYFKLKGVNESLVAENEMLKNKLATYEGIDTLQQIVASIPIVKIDSVKMPDSVNGFKMVGERKILRYANYDFLPAKVINNSIASEEINYITLNRGSKDGVEKGMAVVSYIGIVGRVVNVNSHFATVVSILSKGERKISAQLQDGTVGVASWKGGDPDHIVMEKLPFNAITKVKDSVYATGFSYFPENYLIGSIAAVDTNKNNNTKLITIKLATNFRKLHNVYVVSNSYDKERKAVEATNSQEN